MVQAEEKACGLKKMKEGLLVLSSTWGHVV